MTGPPPSQWQSVVQMIGWSTAGAVATRSGNLILSVLLARVLEQNQYGAFAYVQSTVTMAATIAGAGTGIVATKIVSEGAHGRSSSISEQLSTLYGAIMILAGASVLLLLLVLLLTDLFSEVSWPVLLAMPLVPLAAIQGLQIGALVGFELHKKIGEIVVVSAFVNIIAACGLAHIAGVTGAVLGLLIGSAVTAFLLQTSILGAMRNSGILYSSRPSFSMDRNLWRFALPSLLSSLVGAPVAWATMSMLKSAAGLAAVADFNVANQWRQLVVFLPTIICTVLLPRIIRSSGGEGSEAAKRLFIANLSASIIISSLAATAVAIGAPMLVGLYGASYESATPALRLLAFSGVLSSAAAIVGQIIIVQNRMWLGFGLNASWGIVLCAASYLLSSEGAVGLAWAYTSAYLFHLFGVSIVSTKWLKLG